MSVPSMTTAVVRPVQAAAMPRPPDNLATPILARHDLELEYYDPRGTDRQTPHDRDELYFIIAGNGQFTSAGARRPFHAGDSIFVPAGVEHRFENFSDDFATWVVFFGPKAQ